MKFSIFNPFTRIAGWKAFAIGLPVILLSAVLGYLSHTHFDGALDAHMSDYGNIYLYFAEGLIDFVCLLIIFYIVGVIISGFHFRFIDLMGTISLSRVPMIFVTISAFLFPQQKFSDYLNYILMHKGDPVTITAADIAGFIISVFVIILVIIWTVALYYNAYRICVNKKGAKLIVSFIIALIVSETVSKIMIIHFFSNPILNQFQLR